MPFERGLLNMKKRKHYKLQSSERRSSLIESWISQEI